MVVGFIWRHMNEMQKSMHAVVQGRNMLLQDVRDGVIKIQF